MHYAITTGLAEENAKSRAIFVVSVMSTNMHQRIHV